MSDIVITDDLARQYARLHSLQLPFSNDSSDLIIEELSTGIETRRDGLLHVLDQQNSCEAASLARVIADVNWKDELYWVRSYFDRFACQKGLVHCDPNYLHVLVRHDEEEDKTMIVDDETAMYAFRGVDIGGHFNEHMYAWRNPQSRLTGCARPGRSGREAFCRTYSAEGQVLNKEPTAFDTVDHLLVEAEIGTVYQLLFSVLMCIVTDQVCNADRFMLQAIEHMMEQYKLIKNRFISMM